MRLRRPETLALLVALLGSVIVLTAFVVNLFLSRERELREAQSRLSQVAVLVAEQTARSIDAVDLVLRELTDDLARGRRDAASWHAGRGWELISQRPARSLPQVRELLLIDADGAQRQTSPHSAATLGERERGHLAPLAAGAAFTTYGPFLAPPSDRYTYGLARRLTDSAGNYGGVVAAHLEPAYFPEHCWANRLGDEFEAVLINSRRQIVASCRPVDPTRQASILGSDAAALADGQLADAWLDGPQGSIGRWEVATSSVPGYPDLKVLALMPRTAFLAPWSRRATEFGLFAGLVVSILLAGGWLVRRQVAELSQLTAALDENRRHLEERIREATAELAFKKEEAERASTAKSRFLAAASHDLRQPLHALSLFAADLQRQVRSGNTGGLERVSEQIATSTSVLGELLDSLLDVSRLDVAGIKTEIAPFALQTVFQRLAASYRRPAQAKRLTLRFRPSARYAVSDVTLVERLLANLISNAIRYTPEGGRVLIAARPQGSRVRIEVRDSGIGIAPEHQAAIFAEFYQVGNTAREQNKGLGLGLSIVDRLAHALEVPITLRSRPGTGTTFAVALQECPPEIPEAPAPVQPERRPELRLLGGGEALATAGRLANSWGWDLRPESLEACQAAPPTAETIVIADRASAAALADARPDFRRLIVVLEGQEPAPVGCYALLAPIRPAKLRALLEQLQKTESRSIP